MVGGVLIGFAVAVVLLVLLTPPANRPALWSRAKGIPAGVKGVAATVRGWFKRTDTP